jgi:cell division protein FtsI (penicillin-binding protein 3)
MEGALRLMDVPPDDIGTWLAAQRKHSATRTHRAGLAAVQTPASPVAPLSAAMPVTTTPTRTIPTSSMSSPVPALPEALDAGGVQ